MESTGSSAGPQVVADDENSTSPEYLKLTGNSDQILLARQATRNAIEQGNIIPGWSVSNPEITSVESRGSMNEGTGKTVEGAGKVVVDTVATDNVTAVGTGGIGAVATGAVATGLGVNGEGRVEITLRTLLEAGAHFGHQTSRWNPAMAPYIYGSRNGIHIINLPKSVQAWQRAKKAIEDVAAQGGSFLFVGTKKQAQEAIAEEARRCNSFFVAERWLGGMLTNFSTVRKSVDRMKKLEETLKIEEELISTNASPKFTKKERLMFSRELEKLTSSIGGVRDMTALPSMLFVIDIKREEIAIKEAKRLDIPVAALVDTNCDPAVVPYAIPSNDDGTRIIRLFSRAVADSIIVGRRRYVPRPQSERQANSGGNSGGGERRDERRDNRGGRGRKNQKNENQRSETVVTEQAAPEVHTGS